MNLLEKFYIAVCIAACSLAGYLNATGWSAFAAKAEWTPGGPHVGGSHGSHHIYFHK